jgi:hypothetical protein
MRLGDSTRSSRIDYDDSWCSVQNRDRLVWLIAISFVPCMAALMIGVMIAAKQVAPQLFLYAAVVWLVAHAAASRYREEFRCPRCRQRFFPRGSEVHSCVSCGLPLWSHGSGDAFEAHAGTSAP